MAKAQQTKAIPWIDIHTHLNETADDIIKIQNLFPDEYKKAEGYSFVSMGIHPWYVNDWEHKYSWLEKNITQINAIGETGLDKICKTPFECQIEVFEKQLELAEKFNKPVIIHCVKAYSELIQIKKQKFPDLTWIIHAFNENKQIAEQLLNLGCYFSFGKFIMIDGTKARSSYDILPLERIFFETDEQECLSIQKVYNMGASLKGMEIEVLKERIYSNFVTVFDN